MVYWDEVCQCKDYARPHKGKCIFEGQWKTRNVKSIPDDVFKHTCRRSWEPRSLFFEIKKGGARIKDIKGRTPFQIWLFNCVFGRRSLLNADTNEPLLSVRGKNDRKCNYRRSDQASYTIQVYKLCNHSVEIQCSIQQSAKVHSVAVDRYIIWSCIG